MGDKKAYILEALLFIQNEIGIIKNISSIYETPAWGFEGPSFYNIGINVSSDIPINKVLQIILDIELKIGRIRSGDFGYQSRCIDIDIIAFGDTIINKNDLQVPHKLMHDRKFVLFPFSEINPNWKHPIFNKFITELINMCTDTCEISKVNNIDFEILQLPINKNYLVIEGVIGAGKTSLVKKLYSDFETKTVLEQFADNPFLPKFYDNPDRFAFPLEMSFLTERYQQLTTELAQLDLFSQLTISDYYLNKSLLFAKATLQEDEFRLYQSLYTILYKELPKPDLYVYLYQSPEKLLENILKRGRVYEQNITLDYLQLLQDNYLDFLKNQTDFKTLIIDCTKLDFVTQPKDYLFLLKLITQNLI